MVLHTTPTGPPARLGLEQMEAGIEGVMEEVRKDEQTLLCRLRPRGRDFLLVASSWPSDQERQQALSQVLPSAGPAIVCTILQLVASTIRGFKTG